ncbi:MAG: hydrogenase [Oligoflexia bacterium]|nr:hydrogenase [Oligoflexia bacterium]
MVLSMIDDGAQIVHYLGFVENNCKKLMIVLRTIDNNDNNDNNLFIAITFAPTEYLAFTSQAKKFHLFEREIHEEFSINIQGHPQLKAVRSATTLSEEYQFYNITGDSVHQVAVGPVHAGIIGPGHFRFNCMGERVAHLEIKLGYQHRGVEKLICKSCFDITKLSNLMECVAGDSAVTNILTFSELIESAFELEKEGIITSDIKIIRTIALELERLSNHIGDLGALSGDVAFLPPDAYFGRMRGEFLNLLLLLSGNRFGKGLIRPAINFYKINLLDINYIEKKLNELLTEIKHVSELLFSTQEIIDRFEGIGVIDNKTALDLGLVGVAARASGVKYDVRKNFLPGYYSVLEKENKNITIQQRLSGDVWSRARIRYKEILDSISIIKNMLENLKSKTDYKTVEQSQDDSNFSSNYLLFKNKLQSKLLPSSAVIVAINEGWRGELTHLMITDEKSKIIRYKIKDPSFHNWSGLAYAMRDQEISDFPLCNKSFNLSYCGFDL